MNCNTLPPENIPTSSEPNLPVTDNPTTVSVSESTVTPTIYSPTTEDTPNDNNTTVNDDTPTDSIPTSTPTNSIPTSTPHCPIEPCILTPKSKIHKPCLPLIHIPKPTPCSLPVTYSHSHIPLKFCPPNHASCPPSHAHFHSIYNPTNNYKSNADITLNSQEEILLKMLKSLISNSNLQSPPTSK